MLNIPAERHPAVRAYARYFDGAHLTHPDLIAIMDEFENLAQNMLNRLGDAPEVSHMLRRLVEAKDCAMRAKADELVAAGTPAVNRPNAGLTLVEDE